MVLVEELFAGGYVADGDDVDALVLFEGFAVGGAGMVDEHGGSEAVNNLTFLPDSEEIGDDAVGVAVVGGLFGNARAVVLDDAGAAANRVKRVAPGGMDRRRTDDQTGRGGSFGHVALSIASQRVRSHRVYPESSGERLMKR